MANKESEHININLDIDTSEFISEPIELDLNFNLSSDIMAELKREFAGSISHRGGRASKHGEVKVRKLTDEELERIKEANEYGYGSIIIPKRNYREERAREFAEKHSITLTAKTVRRIASECEDQYELASKLRKKTGRYIPMDKVYDIIQRALNWKEATIE